MEGQAPAGYAVHEPRQGGDAFAGPALLVGFVAILVWVLIRG